MLEPALPPSGQPSHAYLFLGPAGSGKRTVAREFAAALLSDGAADPVAVAERVQRGTHPDLTWVAPSGAAGMLVSDVDEAVVAAAAHTPFEATRRVFVIEGAESLNEAAANRMLKTLEEPPPYAHLILIANRPSQLRATVTSRCQHVRFDALAPDALAERLREQGVGAEEASACARLALGDGELAAKLAQAEGRKLRAAAETLARSALAGEVDGRPWMALLALAKQAGKEAEEELEPANAAELELISRKERARTVSEQAERARRAKRRATDRTIEVGLELAGLWYRDVAVVATGAGELVHATDRHAELEADAAGRSLAALLLALDAVEQARRGMALNVNEELALEALAYRVAAIAPRDGSSP